MTKDDSDAQATYRLIDQARAKGDWGVSNALVEQLVRSGLPIRETDHLLLADGIPVKPEVETAIFTSLLNEQDRRHGGQH